MNAVIAVFNSLSESGQSRYTADFAAPSRSKCTATFRTHCIIRNNKSVIRRYITFIITYPKQLHVSAAQSSHNHAVSIRNHKTNYLAVTLHVFLKSMT
jgi:hypothetical protein